MTISTVPTERLKQIASGNAFTCTQDDESASMAAELLAVREAQSDDINLLDMKPQEWFESLGKSPLMCAGLGVDVVQRMAAKIAILMQSQTAPAVPDFGALTKLIVGRLIDCGTANDDSIADAEVFVYNACRAAMLTGGKS